MTALSTPGMKLAMGDIVAYLDADGCFLRAVAVAGEEVLRGIGFVVRDRDWGTYLLQAAPEIERDAEAIIIRVRGAVRSADGTLDWSLVWTLRRNGIEASCDCTSGSGFMTARTGFVVLHSLSAARGRRVAITHEDGSVEDARFPSLISPHQPFMAISGMAYETAGGHRLRFSFAGEIFETEDQRNWTDASYKTYSRPLSKPFPYCIAADAAERQRVTLDLLHVAPASILPAASPVSLRHVVMPPLGLGVPPGAAAAGLGDALRRLAPGFTAVEIDLARDPRLDETRLLIASVPGPLRLDIRPAAEAAVLDALRILAPLLPGHVLTGVSLWGADERLIAAARALLPGLRIGGGTGAFFTELNRGKHWPEAADYLAWTATPTYHGSSDDTIGESVEALADILATAKAKWPGQRFQIGPNTLGARFNPNATTPEGLNRPSPADPRQGQPIAAAWLLGTLAGFADDVVETIAFCEPQGARGLIDAQGEMTPAGALFARLAALQGRRVAMLAWPHNPRLVGLGVAGGAGTDYCVANLHHAPVEVPLPEGETVPIGGFGTIWLNGR